LYAITKTGGAPGSARLVAARVVDLNQSDFWRQAPALDRRPTCRWAPCPGHRLDDRAGWRISCLQ